MSAASHDPVRKEVLALLRGGQAHADLEKSLAGITAAEAGQKPPAAAHTLWELIEHIRIAQRDILEFSRAPKHVSPAWPEGYWPATPAPPSAAALKHSLAALRSDLAEFIALVEHGDLLTPLPHDSKKNLLREALLLADHNAYHLGQLVELRKMLGAWPG